MMEICVLVWDCGKEGGWERFWFTNSGLDSLSHVC